jgi:hypothetical protein
LLERLAALQQRFGERYPGLVDQARRTSRLRVEDLEKARRKSEIEAAECRLTKVINELEARDRAVEKMKFDPSAWTISDGEGATSWELASTCALGLVERERATSRATGERVTENSLSLHLKAGSLSTPVTTANQAVAGHGLLLEDMLRRSARLKGEVELFGTDAPLWCAALATAPDSDARYRVRTNALLATPEDAGKVPEEVSHSYYVVPLGHELVAISQTWRSAIRLWSARVALGVDVDAQVIADEVSRSPEIAAADITELFTGFRRVSAWYKPHTRLRATVVGHFPDGWIARLKRKGVLHRGSNTPWKKAPTDSSEFRVLYPEPVCRHEPTESPDRIANPDGVPAGGFAGFSTTEVATSVAGDQLAWRRDPSNRGRAAHRALEAEWSLMVRLARGSRTRARALTPVAWTMGEAARSKFPLYRIPIAITPNTPQFRNLVGLNLSWRLFTIRVIAKAVAEVHRHGLVLGTVHHDQFVYAVDPSGPSHLLVPRPILAYAPAVCPVGDRHVADTRLDHEAVVYPHLKTPLLNPFAASSQAAAVYHDAFSFGVCALELLATTPLSVATVFYNELNEAVHALPAGFAHVQLARRIATALTVGPNDGWLVRLFEALGKSLKLDAEEWLAV